MLFTVKSMPFKEKLKCFLRYYKNALIIAGILLAILAAAGIALTYAEPEEEPAGGLGPKKEAAFRDIANNQWKSLFDMPEANDLTVEFNSTSNELMMGGTAFNVGGLFSVSNTIKSFACALAALLWCISLGTAFINQSAYAEILIKRFIVLVITIACITISFDLCTYICNVGVALVNRLNESVSHEVLTKPDDILSYLTEAEYQQTVKETEEDYKKMDEEYIIYDSDSLLEKTKTVFSFFLDKILSIIPHLSAKMSVWFSYHFGEPISVMVTLLLPWLVHWLAYVLILVSIYARGIEIVLMSLFAPIPFALVSDNQLGNGVGARFLKNMGALALQGAVMLVIMTVCTYFIATLGKDFIDVVNGSADMGKELADHAGGVLQIVAISVVEAMLLLRSNSIAQKILGLS